MELELTIIVMEQYMSDNGKKITNMDRVKRHGQMVLFMRVNIGRA